MNAPPSAPAAPPLSARVLEVLGELATVQPTVAEVAAELGVEPSALGGVVASLEHSGQVDVWPCPDRPGSVRLMLSARTVSKRGLRLSRCGKRWVVPESA